MKGSTYGQHQSSFGTHILCQVTCLFYSCFMPRYHYLARTVVIGWYDSAMVLCHIAALFHLVSRQPDYGSHCSHSNGYCLLHELPSLSYKGNCILNLHSLSCY